MEHYFTNNENLESKIRKISYNYKDTSFCFYSDLGVFSKNKIDYGTKVLLESYLENASLNKRVLDIGCGYGVIGIVISKITNSFSTLIDINKRAVHLTSRNIIENNAKCESFVSDMYSSVTSKYDIIITNPPIRIGKEKVLNLLRSAKDYMNKDGELWYVIRKDQGAKSINEHLLDTYNITLVEKSKGFYVFKAKIN